MGDLFCIRETPGLSGRVGMYEVVTHEVLGWKMRLSLDSQKNPGVVFFEK